jgi:hypothetical protein
VREWRAGAGGGASFGNLWAGAGAGASLAVPQVANAVCGNLWWDGNQESGIRIQGTCRGAGLRARNSVCHQTRVGRFSPHPSPLPRGERGR